MKQILFCTFLAVILASCGEQDTQKMGSSPSHKVTIVLKDEKGNVTFTSKNYTVSSDTTIEFVTVPEGCK